MTVGQEIVKMELGSSPSTEQMKFSDKDAQSLPSKAQDRQDDGKTEVRESKESQAAPPTKSGYDDQAPQPAPTEQAGPVKQTEPAERSPTPERKTGRVPRNGQEESPSAVSPTSSREERRVSQSP